MHPFPAILTAEDLARSPTHSTHVRARENRVRYYRHIGRLVTIRKGQWAVVPENTDPATYRVNPFLVAATLSPDATLAYHTALEYHGKAYATFQKFQVLSRKEIPPFRFQEQEFRTLGYPQALRRQQEELFGVQESEQEGVRVRVTGLERTLVDVMHRPEVSGGLEEIWRSLESIEFLNVEKVTRYAELLNNARTTAAVGFYLEQHRETLLIDEAALTVLARRRPKAAQYLSPGARKGGQLVPRWNLLVSPAVLERRWEEPG